MRNILIVEDEIIFALYMKRILTAKGYKILKILSDGRKAVNLALTEKPEAILMDINLKGELNGVETAQEIYRFYRPQIIFISAYDKITFDYSGLDYSFLQKPIWDTNLLSLLSIN